MRGVLLLAVVFLTSCSSTGWLGKGGSQSQLAAFTTAHDEDYKIRPGDILQMDVFQEPELQARQRVERNGGILFPLLGRVQVADETAESASKKLAALLDKKAVVSPFVTVTILSYAPRRFTVLGQVRSPGSYNIPDQETVSLPQAIALAGGPSDTGNIKKVVVSREIGSEVRRVRLNALDPAIKDFIVEEGDVIFVSETIF